MGRLKIYTSIPVTPLTRDKIHNLKAVITDDDDKPYETVDRLLSELIDYIVQEQGIQLRKEVQSNEINTN